MLRETSVRQLLEVLELTRLARARGVPLGQAYQDAIRDVSNRHHVRYQTIGDLCRRRLGLRDMDQFADLLRRWLGGDAAPLRRAIRQNADFGAHRVADAYFDTPNTLTEGQEVPKIQVLHASKEAVPHFQASQRSSPPSGPRVALHLQISSELDRKVRLAQLAGIGSTKEDAAIALLEQGIVANRERIIGVIEGI